MSATNITDEKECDSPIQLGEWLQQWELQQYQKLLHKNGIKKPNDFLFVKTKQHFDKLVERLGDDMSFMDTLKLEDAWLTIVPSPKKEEPKVHFLDDDANRILHKLTQRYKNLSDDIDIVQTGCNEFNRLTVKCKEDINNYATEMIQCIETEKTKLLNHVGIMQSKEKFNQILKKLQKMNVQCQNSKTQFQQIAVNTQLTTQQKEEKMEQLLAINIENRDDEKELNYNHHKSIGNRLKMPEKITAQFKKVEFEREINLYFSVKYEEIEKFWTLKPDYRSLLKDGKYKLKSVKTSRFIDVEGYSSSVGGILHQWSSHSGSNQQFCLKQGSSGYYTVKCVCSKLFWKIKDGKLIQDKNNGGDDQLFGFIQVEAKKFCIVSKHSNKSLHVPNSHDIIEHDINYSNEQLFWCNNV